MMALEPKAERPIIIPRLLARRRELELVAAQREIARTRLDEEAAPQPAATLGGGNEEPNDGRNAAFRHAAEQQRNRLVPGRDRNQAYARGRIDPLVQGFGGPCRTMVGSLASAAR